ncbi:hypothetical protein E2C01_010097 [Portunus trituberculatus]|uniref:Uncharacterized protein n=1 Tax=Portunus trituberculatus TaxID=210409 RepID=A0A5B7D7S6_PORTR|nr:hypothetical protein [Portunus trituberculatus]
MSKSFKLKLLSRLLASGQKQSPISLLLHHSLLYFILMAPLPSFLSL